MDVPLLISIIALAISVLGWAVSYWFTVRAANIGRRRDYGLKIYFGLLGRTNELIQHISSYTTATVSHTNAMANLMNEYISDELALATTKAIDRRHELKKAWLEASYNLSEQSFIMQRAIEEYFRYLDMNGTDYGRGTEVFRALQTMKNEAYKSAESNRKRWNDASEMDKITPEQYSKKSAETKMDADSIFDFGMCLDDVLVLMYNSAIAHYLGKPKKMIDMNDKRRYITSHGLVDKRSKKKKDKV